MLLTGRVEAADALVHVPAERADDADVVVVPHVAVGHDVETGFFLVANHGGDRVVVRLLVLHFLESDADIADEQLVLEPVRPRIRADHRGRKQGLDDFCGHGAPWCPAQMLIANAHCVKATDGIQKLVLHSGMPSGLVKLFLDDEHMLR